MARAKRINVEHVREMLADISRFSEMLTLVVTTWETTRMPMPTGLVGHVTPEQFREASDQLMQTRIDKARAVLAEPGWVSRIMDRSTEEA